MTTPVPRPTAPVRTSRRAAPSSPSPTAVRAVRPRGAVR
ncbi:Uncharacterised protein [Streptomyces griseus]|uniref:Uncharacterized protein n=1 Tax=Streptomyces griseus TaxID=1911 RepID=A0A380P5M8_STRGR|nr:Uncharacterised protein [Streptomyces griseus]